MSTENLRQTVDLIAMALSEDGGYEYYHVNDKLKELAKDVADMQAENAKLRQELEAVGTAAYLYGRTDLADENAKLRELVRELYEDQCDDCDRWKYHDRMSELGVEVDG